jgi:hypothetical protein
LPPGFRGTPEQVKYEEKHGFRRSRELYREIEGHTRAAITRSLDFSLLREFHESGVDQVVKMTGTLFEPSHLTGFTRPPKRRPRPRRIRSVPFEIPRKTIEKRDVSAVVARLNGLVEDKESARSAMGSVSILVDGYDDDPREIYQIPEVRDWYGKLVEAVPHLLFFLFPEAQAVKNLYLVLNGGPKAGGKQVAAFFKSHMESADAFCVKCGIDPERDKQYGEFIERAIESLSH